MRTVDESPVGQVTISIDWKASVEEVLKIVDSQLYPHGLEVVQIDTGSDTYEWYIEKKG